MTRATPCLCGAAPNVIVHPQFVRHECNWNRVTHECPHCMISFTLEDHRVLRIAIEESAAKWNREVDALKREAALS